MGVKFDMLWIRDVFRTQHLKMLGSKTHLKSRFLEDIWRKGSDFIMVGVLTTPAPVPIGAVAVQVEPVRDALYKVLHKVEVGVCDAGAVILSTRK